MLIREFQAGDEERMAELSRQLGYPSTPAEIRIRLEPILGDPGHGVFVAEREEGGAAGWIHVFVQRCVESEARAEVAGLVVDEALRRRGAGRLLMACAERWAAEKGCGIVSLRTNIVREEAHRFYESLGYRCVKTQHTYRRSLDAGSASPPAPSRPRRPPV
jgi:GNAT superfamily N-acetyltransferase